MSRPDNTMTTPTSAHVLPRWAYLALALACVCMGLWASYITLQYFEHGAKALETDGALQSLAVAAALMFVASEMAAFALAALLTERQLKARRWSLTGFAGAVLALEVCTIVAVQLALTSGADLTQSTVQVQEKDLRARIAAIEADAAAKRATADQQRATAKNAYELHLASKSSDKAAAEQAKTAALYDELAKVQAQKRPTLTGLLGEKYALAYAVARGILVSLGGLVFFGTAGALLRAARGGVLSIDQQILQLLHELRGTPGTLAAPAQAVALATPAAPIQPAPPPSQAPALASPSFKPAGTVAPAGVPVGVSYRSKAALAGAGVLGAMGAAPMAHSAPAVPMQAKAPAVPAATAAVEPVIVDTPGPVNVDTPASANVGTPAALDVGILTSPEPVNVDTPSPVNDDTPKAAPKARKPRVERDGSVMDTGVGEHDGFRYRRAMAGVKAGKIRPSIDGLYEGVGVTAPTARRFLAAMADAGVLVRKGQGYVLAEKYLAKLAQKGGAA